MKALQLFVSIALLSVLFIKVPVEKVLVAVQSSDTGLLVFALLFAALAWIVNTKKWQFLLSFAGIRISYLRLLKHNLLAIFYSIILPGQISGEVVKAYQISRNESQKTDIVTSVIVDKISGLLILFWLGVLTLPVTMSHVPTLFAPILLLAAIGIVLTLCSFSRRWYLFVSSLLLAIPLLRRFSKSRDRVSSFVASYQQYGKYGTFIQTVGFALLFQIFATVSFMFVALAFGIRISPLEYFWVFAVVSLLLFLPISLAGLGVREGSLIFLFNALGIASERALAASIALFAINIVMGGLGILLQIFHAQPARNVSNDKSL